MLDINTMKSDIIEYGLYALMDDELYGAYKLTILNEDETVWVRIRDEDGSACSVIDKTRFLNMTNEGLKKFINEALYYGYTEIEEEE
jgi:hypothetical protein